MALTRDYSETVRERLKADPAFRAALLAEVSVLQQAGDIATADAVLRKIDAADQLPRDRHAFTSR
jgi:hypothetical protein